MGALHQVLEFLHALRYVFGQVGVYIVIIFDGIGRAGFSLHDGGMAGTDIVAAGIGLCGMLYDAGVPDMRCSEFLYFP